MARPALLLAAVLLVLGGAGCSAGDGAAAPGSSSTAATSSSSSSSASGATASTEVERDYTATTGPDCTRGTIPEGTPVPPGCDRLYSPFVAPGRDCTEGQVADCIDPDGDGRFTVIVFGGTCLVERGDVDRCRDDDGDGQLDEPLTEDDRPG